MLEPLRTTSLLGSLVALLLDCGAAPAPEPQAPAADAEAKLKSAAQAHGELASQLAAAPKEALAHCRTTAGDCLISVAERREAVIGKHYLNACRELAPEKQSACITSELERHALRQELASYYETENWCSRKLLECMTAFAHSAERTAIAERAQERRAQVEAAPESASPARAPEFAGEKLTFVRAILPPNGQAACPPTADEACEKKLAAPSSAFEAELVKAPASYDAKRALTLYAALQRAEAECSAPQLSCLLEQLPQYGASAESDKLLKQNLSLIAQQQQIRVSADPEPAEQCISAGVTQHSDRIVSAYQTYAGAPTAYSFVRLQKAFIAMHQTQLWCLLPKAKASKR